GGNDVVNCLTGQINITSGGKTVAFDRATFVDSEWYGSTCDGKIYHIDGLNPFFNCYDTVVPTTTATPVDPCLCAYQDTGVASSLPAPSSSCLNNENHVLQCADKISVQIGEGLSSFDKLSCSEGGWYGMNCDGEL
ncbi:hypothetical protein PFISCL1PPCAC_4875, partial [Pristionchus fissidentatus]